MQCGWDVRAIGRDVLEFAIDFIELVQQYPLQQRNLARKAGVQRFFAHADFFSQIVHGDPAESMR